MAVMQIVKKVMEEVVLDIMVVAPVDVDTVEV
jgi:hypothetical protein